MFGCNINYEKPSLHVLDVTLRFLRGWNYPVRKHWDITNTDLSECLCDRDFMCSQSQFIVIVHTMTDASI